MPPIPRPQKEPSELKPRCPYCGMRPCEVALRLVAFGGDPFSAPAAIFICGTCEKILSVAPLPQVPEKPNREESRILLPQ